jgi:large subunit ribosomal protein L14e
VIDVFDVGRVCLKTAGREAGKYCIIVKKVDDNFVMVTGPKSLTSVKRRRCNINHLEPITEKLNIKSDASDSDILKAYQEASLLSRLGIEKPRKAAVEKPAAEKHDKRAGKARPEGKGKKAGKPEKKVKKAKPEKKEKKAEPKKDKKTRKK